MQRDEPKAKRGRKLSEDFTYSEKNILNVYYSSGVLLDSRDT